MATKAQKVRLSLFLIISSSVLLLFFLVLVGNQLLKRMNTYYIVYEDVSVTGLEPGAAVKFHGVQVGRVTGLAVKDAASVIIEIEVERDTPVKTDTEAILTLVGITGLKFVELIGGTRDAKMLPPKSEIIAGESLFENISGSAEILLAKLEQIMNNLNDMTGPETTESLNLALTSVASLGAQMDSLLMENRYSFKKSMEGLEVVMQNLTSMTVQLDSTMVAVNAIIQSGNIQGTLANINSITDEVRTGIDSLRMAETAVEFRSLVGNANNMVISYDLLIAQARDDILRSLRNLEEALYNLREATDVIRENPSVLIRGRRTAGDRIE